MQARDVDRGTLITLKQDTEDTTSWVGAPGRRKVIADPVYRGLILQALGQGPRGNGRHLVGVGLPLYLYRNAADRTWHVSLLDPRALRPWAWVPTVTVPLAQAHAWLAALDREALAAHHGGGRYQR